MLWLFLAHIIKRHGHTSEQAECVKSNSSVLGFPHSSRLHNDLVRHILLCVSMSSGTFCETSGRLSTYPLQFLERQADAVLHPDFITDTALLAQDSDGLHLDTVLDDAGLVAGDRHRRTLDTSPGTDTAVPSNDGVKHASVMLDLSILEHDRLLDSNTSTNRGAWTNGDIRTQLSSGVDMRRGVNEDGWDDVGRGLGELLRVVLPRLLEVQCVRGDGGASCLDLAPEVLGLVHEECLVVGHVAKNVLFETDHSIVAARLVVVIGLDEGVLEVVGRGV